VPTQIPASSPLLDLLKSRSDFDDGATALAQRKAELDFKKVNFEAALQRLANPPSMREGLVGIPTRNPDVSQTTEVHPLLKGYDHSLDVVRTPGPPAPLDPNHPKLNVDPSERARGGTLRPDEPPRRADGAPYWWPKDLAI